MSFLSLLIQNPVYFFVLAALLLYSVIVHEVAHGWVALRFGDDTARRQGRLTLNPFNHIDPVGTLMLFVAGFGWARPVPVNYGRLRYARLALFCVSLAGCLANVLIAVCGIIVLRSPLAEMNPGLTAGLVLLVRINIILAAFNLIPIPPLDGSRILMSVLSPPAQERLARVEPYGFFILAFLLFTGALNPVIGIMEQLIYGGIGVLLGAG
ncbi:MAG: site-2 protease family protein [Candidatus Omnitrophica bacterium]|nr:site-2 protease family protein [Candidatus Omnitrophota bacterium]